MTESHSPLPLDASAEPAPEPSVSAAVLLRQAREAADLPLEALAGMLKVPIERLRALEEGRYDDLPNLTFARALASSVCRALKIDAAPVLRALPQAAETRLGSDAPQQLPTFVSQRRSPLARIPISLSLRSPLLWAAIVLVAAAALWWWLPQGGVSPSPAPAGTDSPSEPVVEMVTPAQGVQFDAPQEPRVAQPAARLPAQASAAATEAAPLLRLSAREAVWVRISGANGKPVLQRMLQAGESVDLSEDSPYSVVIDRAEAVEVAVRGQAFDLKSHTRNLVARFEVK